VSWWHVLPLAVVLAFANGFWMIALRGAVGAIERTSAPFSAWLHESTVLVPVYVVAVLAAFMLAQRWFGPRPRGLRAAGLTIATLAVVASAAGTLLMAASVWFDFVLQRADLQHMSATHGCDPACVSARVQATVGLELKALWIGLLLMLVTDLLLIALVIAFRGGEIVLAKPARPRGADRREDAHVVLAAGLVGAAVIHVAVMPEHLRAWLPGGALLTVLALAEVATAGAVLSRRRAWQVPALIGAVVVSAVPLLIWIMARVTGPPFGPRAWKPEAVGVADVLSCALGIATLAIAVTLLRRRAPGTPWSRHALALALTSVVAATVLGVAGADLPVVGAFAHLAPDHSTHLFGPQG